MDAVLSLPVSPTSFVGRAAELDEISDLMANPACRLVTLVGPGGIGKTRLAIQAAALQVGAFPDGIIWVSLQPLSSPEFLVTAIAEACRYKFVAQQPARLQLLNYLSRQRLLLALDNFEHLLPGAELVSAILEAAPQVKVLVTSREVLGLREEWIRPVQGLTFPGEDEAAALEEFSAIQLFAERARQGQPAFSLEQEGACAARVCRLVQGMPLAIELAAAWLRTLSCAEVVNEIQHSLDFLATGLKNIPERHRSMRAVFDQSWRLLSPVERQAFKKLSVFQGGFRRDAADFVAGADLAVLQALLDKSLLSAAAGRYAMHELLRQFALEKLDEAPQERQRTQDRHAVYFSQFLQRQESRLKGSQQLPALAEIDAEIDNVRVAWRRAVEVGMELEIRQAMNGLVLYYQMRSRQPEALEAFQRAVQRFEEGSPELKSLLETVVAWMTAVTGSTEVAGEMYARCYPAIKNYPSDAPFQFAFLGLNWHSAHFLEAEAFKQFFQARASNYVAINDHWSAAWALYCLGIQAAKQGGYEAAAPLYLQSLDQFRACDDRWGTTWALHALGSCASEAKHYQEARPLFEESLKICQEVGDQGGVAFALHMLGEISTGLGEYPGAWRYLISAAEIDYKIKSRMPAWHLFDLSLTLAAAGWKTRAVEILAFLATRPEFKHTLPYSRDELEKLRPGLPPDVFERACRVGDAHDFSSFLAYLAAELEQAEKTSGRAPAPATSGVPGLVEPLSERELQVLACIASGMSNREIAARMYITVGTVKKHTNNIFGKLQVSSRTQAVAKARDLHLLG